MKRFFLSILLLILSVLPVFSQQPSQTIRGQIADQLTEVPLFGATVVVTGSAPLIGATSDIDGKFRLPAIPVGRYTLKINMLGYQEQLLPNIVVGSGKELVLNVRMTERVVAMKEVEITAGSANKSEAINELATVSARQFSVEETKRYAGSFNDPGRMAQSFAGVTVNSDGTNEIVVRGNSPRGLLWKMEGVEIPNPNHFSNQGSSGGAISMLSTNMMANSEFYTGAFPADYGNAASGVFDIRLRKGNNEKREYAFQAGVIGTDVALEGPFRKGYGGSYLINYRYSSLAVLQKIGVKIVGDAVPVFQDLSYNINLPTKRAGNFTLFGIGGLSSIRQQFDGKSGNYRDKFRTRLGAAGLTHSYLFNDKTWIKTVIAATETGNQYLGRAFDTTDVFKHVAVDEHYFNAAQRAAITLNHKIDRKNSIRAGIIVSRLGYNLFSKSFDESENVYETNIDQRGSTGMVQGFVNYQLRMADRLTINTGLHYSRFLLNNAQSVEPRAGIKWNVAGSSFLSAGFGLHSRLEDLPVYFTQVVATDGKTATPNRELGFSKSRHYVLGFETMFDRNLHFKTEVYYQDLYNIPVSRNVKDAQSLINLTQGFSTVEAVNSGIGRNYGAEVTLEKFFSNRYYYTLTASVFDSKYKGSDGILRNTVYNGNYSGSFLAGKEWKVGEQNSFSVNVRALAAGGRKYTPIKLAESQQAGYGIYDDGRSYSMKSSDYWRLDVGMSYTINRTKTTRIWKIDIQNATNRLNMYSKYYNADTKQEEVATQTGIIPTLSYRIEF